MVQTGGVNNPGMPTITGPGIDAKFQQDVQNASKDDLLKMLQNDKLTKEQRQYIIEALRKLADQECDEKMNSPNPADQAEGKEDKDEIATLMQKLQDGTINEDELDRLSKLLGVPVEELKKIGKDTGEKDK